MKLQFLGIIAFVFSLNCFADGKVSEVKFFNGARLVVNTISSMSSELIFYPADGGAPVKLVQGPNRWARLSPQKSPLGDTPEEIIKSGGMPPRFWPVVVAKGDKVADLIFERWYVSETGQVLTVVAQVNVGIRSPETFSSPDKWEIHSMSYDDQAYLLLVETGPALRTTFRFLRLADKRMAVYKPISKNAYFDSDTGNIIDNYQNGFIFTVSPATLSTLKFFPLNSDVWSPNNRWFPNFEQVYLLNFGLESVGSYYSTPKEKQIKEEKKEDPAKEISVTEKGESDIAEMRSQKAVFKKSASEFAASLKEKPAYQTVGKFQYDRFVLGQTGKTTLVVVDSWTNEITDTITLEDERFLIENTPKGYTTTILYPKTHVEVVYKQPDNESSRLRQIARHEESIPEFCRDIIARELEVAK